MANELTVGTFIEHDRYGEGIIAKVNLVSYEVFFSSGGKVEILKRNTNDFTVLKSPENTDSPGSTAPLDIDAIETLITNTLDKYGMLQEIVPLFYSNS